MRQFFSFVLAIAIIINPLAVNANELILAGGCFWCLEHDLESLVGVQNVESGYSGGELTNPTYENHYGHQEVVRVLYDSNKVSFKDILRLYFRNIDPLDGGGQFCDRGDSYKPVIFYSNQTELEQVNDSFRSASNELKLPIEKLKVGVKLRSEFWIAEDYHQDFANTNEFRYKFYRYTCGRDKRLDALWGDNARSIKEWS